MGVVTTDQTRERGREGGRKRESWKDGGRERVGRTEVERESERERAEGDT